MLVSTGAAMFQHDRTVRYAGREAVTLKANTQHNNKLGSGEQKTKPSEGIVVKQRMRTALCN